MSMNDLPAINAGFNALAACLLGLGFFFIRRKNKRAHRWCMIAAFVASVLFLAGYLTYHSYVAHVLHKGPTVFRDPAWFRPIYLLILSTHTVLAAVIVPMVLMTLWRAYKERFEAHRKLARWTWPIWMYVSVTGVVIYYLLYVKFPQTQ
jgi:uncharacterized membrane protein YozB (DUF420 family)